MGFGFRTPTPGNCGIHDVVYYILVIVEIFGLNGVKLTFVMWNDY